MVRLFLCLALAGNRSEPRAAVIVSTQVFSLEIICRSLYERGFMQNLNDLESDLNIKKT